MLTEVEAGCPCGPFALPIGAWASTDGAPWTAILREESYVAAVAASDGTVIAGGGTGRGDMAAFWVTGAAD